MKMVTKFRRSLNSEIGITITFLLYILVASYIYSLSIVWAYKFILIGFAIATCGWIMEYNGKV